MVDMKDDKMISLALGVVVEGEGLSCRVHSCFSV